jgi:putative phosphoribosyl transferase
MFTDRRDAGRQLAQRLKRLAGHESVVVLGLPRGGVPVAAEVAAVLETPLDVIVVRKLGAPGQPELAVGAVGEDGVRVLNPDVMATVEVSEEMLDDVSRRQWSEVARRASEYRAVRPREPLEGRTAVVVDDGIATGATARAACQIARGHGASHVVLAVPVAPRGWQASLHDVADTCVSLDEPQDFGAVGMHYRDFSPTTDAEVLAALAAPPDRGISETGCEVIERGETLRGVIVRPRKPSGLAIFAHGSGSSHRSVRNRYVARRLAEAGLAAVLVDLLTEREESDRANVFDIESLTERLAVITTWARQQPGLDSLPVGLFGASTGAAAALSASRRVDAAAVVSRGGRPDLALPILGEVTAPTLLIVGGDDAVVLDLNRRALAELHCTAELHVIPGATHLFEEPGALDAVAAETIRWFGTHLPTAPHGE